MQDGDPLAVILAPPPEIDGDLAVEIARTRYGLETTARSLISERDQNFRLTAEDGRRFVLKIANAAEDPVVTDFQIAALLHIAAAVDRHDLPIATPRVQRTLDGEPRFRLDAPGGPYLARLVTFIEGVPLAKRIPSRALARNMGTFLAHLGRALRGFAHPGANHSLLWDLKQAHRLRDLTRYVQGAAAMRAVEGALDDFERHAGPRLGELRSQVVHNDFNADNVVIDAGDPDRVAGVIDFGDMLEAPLVADVAIGASYVRVREGHPLTLMQEFVAAYHRVTPLTPAEVDVLFDLIRARLSASVAILDWRAAMRGDGDPYLRKSASDEVTARSVLGHLREVTRDEARQWFRAACSPPVAERGQSRR